MLVCSKMGKTKQSSSMVLQCSEPGDIGSFLEMTIEIGWIRSLLEEEVRNRTKFENRRVLALVNSKTQRDSMLRSSQQITVFSNKRIVPAPVQEAVFFIRNFQSIL